jgi:hypothetical protein
MRRTGYAHGRPGYVVGHIKPLACGGADDPSNMQLQTKAEARPKTSGNAKDATERGNNNHEYVSKHIPLHLL